MHLLESSLFVDQIAACGAGDLCYVRNDYLERVDVAISFEAWVLESTTPLRIYKHEDVVGPGSIDWFKLPLNFTSNIQVILVRLEVYHDSFISSPRISESVYLKDMPKNIKGLDNGVHVDIVEISSKQNGDATIVLASDKLALFVVLTTRAEGRFSQNCFTLRPSENMVSKAKVFPCFVSSKSFLILDENSKIVTFQPLETKQKVDLQALKSTLRVEHLGIYVDSSSRITES